MDAELASESDVCALGVLEIFSGLSSWVEINVMLKPSKTRIITKHLQKECSAMMSVFVSGLSWNEHLFFCFNPWNYFKIMEESMCILLWVHWLIGLISFIDIFSLL